MVFEVIVEANRLERLEVVNFGRIYYFLRRDIVATNISAIVIHVIKEETDCHLVLGRVGLSFLPLAAHVIIDISISIRLEEHRGKGRLL